MVSLTIDDKKIYVKNGTTILEAAKQNGIHIPTLCYLKDVSKIGACRICLVEIKGINLLTASCITPVQEGMEVYTSSPRVKEARRVNLELILSEHNVSCTSCTRSYNCALQKLANEYSITEVPYHKNIQYREWPSNFPLQRDESKCIKCMRCVEVCEKVQGIGVWDMNSSSLRTRVGVKNHKKIEETACVLCGQCITNCPVGALNERDDTKKVAEVLNDKTKIKIAQIAPAIRTSWMETFGLNYNNGSLLKLVTALKRIGFDYVFDTDFGADLTIMEEGTELLHRLGEKKKHKWPMFTSCCPGWVRFVKFKHPELIDNLSTSKSPHQMQGTIIKTYFKDKIKANLDDLYVVSIMPCVSKKAEIDIENINDSGADKDVDAVLTTREVVRLMKSNDLNVKLLEETPFDSPLGMASGAAHIFGVTGGVMEAALRTASYIVMGRNSSPTAFKEVRGKAGRRECTFDLNGSLLNVAVVSGLSNTEKLIEDIESGKKHYDFVEVMACPNGCINGGGQPISQEKPMASKRGKHLYSLDENSKIRYSHENKDVQKLYKEFLGEPCSKLSEKLLHTKHIADKRD